MIGKKRSMIILVLPVLIIYLGFFVYPVIDIFTLSFQSWNGFSKERIFIGVKNYSDLLRDPIYLHTLQNLAFYVFIGGAICFLFSFLFLWGITVAPKMRNVFRALIFLPNMISLAAAANLWSYIYNPSFGLLNGFLKAIKLDMLTRAWMGPKFIIYAVIIAVCWIQIGFFTIILLTGSQKIPQYLYEAATIDGASKSRCFFNITIPLIGDELKISIFLWLALVIKMFEFIFAFTGGSGSSLGTAEAWTPILYMYILSFGQLTSISRLGYAASVAITILVFILICYFLVNLIFRKKTIELE